MGMRAWFNRGTLEEIRPLTLKKHADLEAWDGVTMPRPLLGIELVDAPARIRVSTTKIAEGLAEGWIDASDPGVEHASGGPPEDPWRVTHTFLTYSKFVFKCLVSPVTYKVVGQPGKDEQGVRWYYECERVSRV